MISGEWTAKHLHRGVSYATFSIGTGTGLIFGRTPSGSGDARYLRMYPSLQHLEPTNQVTLPGQLRSWAKTDGAHDEQGPPASAWAGRRGFRRTGTALGQMASGRITRANRLAVDLVQPIGRRTMILPQWPPRGSVVERTASRVGVL